MSIANLPPLKLAAAMPTRYEVLHSAGWGRERENTMDTLSSIRVEAVGSQGQSHVMAPPDQRRRRAHWLIDLVHALEDTDLDGARVQFAGLVQADPALSHQPLLHRIGNALQSRNLKMAQQLAQELRDEGLAVWNDLAHQHTFAPVPAGRSGGTSDTSSSLPPSVRVHKASNGQHIIDYRA